MTIEERAEDYQCKLASSFLGCTDILDGEYNGYVAGAIDQDPISRADQRKIDIEKAQKAICERFCNCKKKCVEPNTNCDMIWYITQSMEE